MTNALSPFQVKCQKAKTLLNLTGMLTFCEPHERSAILSRITRWSKGTEEAGDALGNPLSIAAFAYVLYGSKGKTIADINYDFGQAASRIAKRWQDYKNSNPEATLG